MTATVPTFRLPTFALTPSEIDEADRRLGALGLFLMAGALRAAEFRADAGPALTLAVRRLIAARPELLNREMAVHWLASISCGDLDPADPPFFPCDVTGHRPDDLPEPGDRCKECRRELTWVGPGIYDWELCDPS